MIDRLLVLGGGSDIARAFVSRCATAGLQSVVLAGRPGGSRDEAAAALAAEHVGLRIEQADFHGDRPATHLDVLRRIDETSGPFDTVVVAFGQLGAPFTLDLDPAEAAALADLNLGGAIAASLAAIDILRGEPNARLVVFSSIAAVRPRIGNIVYGSAKAGLDAFAREITAPAKRVGVEVVVVRPGFVHTRMTDGLDPAPFATTADAVADDLVEGLRKGRAVIHSPGLLGAVGVVLKNLPAPLWRFVSKR